MDRVVIKRSGLVGKLEEIKFGFVSLLDVVQEEVVHCPFPSFSRHPYSRLSDYDYVRDLEQRLKKYINQYNRLFRGLLYTYAIRKHIDLDGTLTCAMMVYGRLNELKEKCIGNMPEIMDYYNYFSNISWVV